MIKVEVNIDIQYPAKKTFAFISNFENNPIWQDGMKSCRFKTKEELQIGSQYDQVAGFLGKEIISTFEVLEYTPDRKVKATTIKSSFPITFTRIVIGDEQISHVNAIIEGEAKGFFKIAKPIMRWMVNRSIQKDYKKLKRMLERMED